MISEVCEAAQAQVERAETEYRRVLGELERDLELAGVPKDDVVAESAAAVESDAAGRFGWTLKTGSLEVPADAVKKNFRIPLMYITDRNNAVEVPMWIEHCAEYHDERTVRDSSFRPKLAAALVQAAVRGPKERRAVVESAERRLAVARGLHGLAVSASALEPGYFRLLRLRLAAEFGRARIDGEDVGAALRDPDTDAALARFRLRAGIPVKRGESWSGRGNVLSERDRYEDARDPYVQECSRM